MSTSKDFRELVVRVVKEEFGLKQTEGAVSFSPGGDIGMKSSAPSKKYTLIPSDKEGLFRVKALKDFRDVKTGDIGGYVESEKNLSQTGECWVYGNAQVFGNAHVFGTAQVFGNAQVYGNARVYGNAHAYDNAQVYGNARVHDNAHVFGTARVYDNAHVCDNARVSGNARVYGNAHVCDNARVFGSVGNITTTT